MSTDNAPSTAAPAPESPEDLDIFVKELMESMQTRFNSLSDKIIGRIDDMGSKIDELEKSVNELVEQVEVETTKKSGDTLTKSNAKVPAKR